MYASQNGNIQYLINLVETKQKKKKLFSITTKMLMEKN